ncbi:MAG: hypothetical protein COV67_03180 [Nitrospinae bacterium CG11_big_fil_rev_8_21_14_0_20_56_8]|nr:MAG: hypothetical protein COV67_03180 [Nitrospinae bacterium CG11_big_fil_rev_8_21_14_0_20_56_8]
MDEHPFIIITCPQCQVKNRVRSYETGKIPVCAKCKGKLVDAEENEVHARYGQSVNRFYNLPDIGLRSDQNE